MEKISPLHLLISAPDNERSFYKDQLAQVLKINCGYACGLCGRIFKVVNPKQKRTQLQLAWDCVTNDALKLNSFPVNEVNSYGSLYINCLLCKKTYVNMEDAALCLCRDLDKITLPPTLNEHLSALAMKILKGQDITMREQPPSRQSLLISSDYNAPKKIVQKNKVSTFVDDTE